MRRSLSRFVQTSLPVLIAAMPLTAWGQEAPHDHASMGHDMAGMAMNNDAPAAADTSADQPGDAPSPPAPTDHAADRFFLPERMDGSRRAMTDEMRFTTLAVQIDRLEYRVTNGANGYGWEGQVWYGGDIDRFVLYSEGDGAFGEKAERVEINAMWRHALDPWFNLQAGLRHDFRPDPERTYALIGIEGLAPYWFEVGGQLLLSNKGDLHARGKAAYQQRITNLLVVEPEAEVDFAFQDVPELNVGSGFERIELGARLRYERNRSLAPYLGVHWERKLGQTARFSRTTGDGASGVSAVFGVRAMF